MFRVRWEKRALEKLTNLWTHGDAAQRKAVTAASYEIDTRLQNNAPNEGESGHRGAGFSLYRRLR
jgi:hypothetical protein